MNKSEFLHIRIDKSLKDKLAKKAKKNKTTVSIIARDLLTSWASCQGFTETYSGVYRDLFI